MINARLLIKISCLQSAENPMPSLSEVDNCFPEQETKEGYPSNTRNFAIQSFSREHNVTKTHFLLKTLSELRGLPGQPAKFNHSLIFTKTPCDKDYMRTQCNKDSLLPEDVHGLAQVCARGDKICLPLVADTAPALPDVVGLFARVLQQLDQVVLVVVVAHVRLQAAMTQPQW